MFFMVLWRDLCQALGWFFGLFGYKRDGNEDVLVHKKSTRPQNNSISTYKCKPNKGTTTNDFSVAVIVPLLGLLY